MRSIIDELTSALGAAKIAVDATTLAAYAVDQAPVLDYQLPQAVVRAESVADVQATVRACAAHGVPLVARGAGTGVSGGAHASEGCVVLSPGADEPHPGPQSGRRDRRRGARRDQRGPERGRRLHGLMYAPDPASFKISTIGGNVATNAGGLRCAKYGVTRDSVLALDVVLADGSLIHTGHQTFKGVAGYDLTGLFVGSEGTLGIVVGVTVRLKYLPARRAHHRRLLPGLPQRRGGGPRRGRARVQPAIMELLDGGTFAQLDDAPRLGPAPAASPCC